MLEEFIMIQAMMDRRSIRKYKAKNVPQPILIEIIRAGSLAPSSKNRQPWKFVVIQGASKETMLAAMEKGLAREKSDPLLPNSAKYLNGAECTLSIMRQAPVVILIVNPLGLSMDRKINAEERIYEICNAQSIGAAVENMSLTATDLGLGSLWICDTYFAYKELRDWLRIKGELYAAMAIGFADEMPSARSRKHISDIIEWRS